MAEASSRDHVNSRDSERAREPGRHRESAQQIGPGAAGEGVLFGSFVGGLAMDLPAERHAALLGDPRLQHPANTVHRARLVSGIQQGYGNRYLQTVLNRAHSSERCEGGQTVIQRIPLRIQGEDVGVYEFLLQTRDRFPRFRGVETGQIQANNLEFGARNYILHPNPRLEEGQTVSLRLGEGVFFLRPASASGIEALGGGVYDVQGVDERGNLEATGLQVSTQGLHAISEGILVYSARIQHIAETRVEVRAPRDTESLARRIGEIVSGAGRLTAPGVTARQIMGLLREAHVNREEMMDILQRLEASHQIAHFMELVSVPAFRRFLRDQGVSWQYIFMHWEASVNDCGQIFAGFLIGAGESVVDAVRLVGTLVGAAFSEELAEDARQFFRAIERFFEHPITNTVHAAREGYRRFVDCLWNLELFEAGRILGNIAILVLTLPEAVRAIPSLARAVTRLSVQAIQETLGVSRAVLRRYARAPTGRMVTPEGHVLMQSGDDIVVIGREGQSARISRAEVLREGGEGTAIGERPTEPGPGFGERPTEPGRGFGERPTEPGRGFGERPTEPGVGFGERPTEPGAGFGERPTEPGVEPTGGAAGMLHEFRTEAAARQIRDDFVGRGRGGWNAAHSEEQLMADWRGAGGTGEPPLAFIDRNGHLTYDARRLGPVPEEILVEGTRARMAGRPPPEQRPGFGERPTEPGVEPTGGAAGMLREFRTEAAARQIRDDFVGRGRGGWNAAHSEEQLMADWRGAGGTGEPPLAFIDRNGHLTYDARRLGPVPEEILVEGTQARMAGRPPSPPVEARAASVVIQTEIRDVASARDMIARWRQAGDPVLFRSPAQMQHLWRAAGRTGEPPVAWVNAQGGLIVNRELVPGE